MNQCNFMGRLTADPTIRYKDDLAIASFSLAVNDDYKKDAVDFLNFTAFGKTAEFVEKYLTKGTKVVLVGCKAKQNSYTNKDGAKINTVNFTVGSIEFAESKKDNDKPKDNGFINVPDNVEDDLPFH